MAKYDVIIYFYSGKSITFYNVSDFDDFLDIYFTDEMGFKHFFHKKDICGYAKKERVKE